MRRAVVPDTWREVSPEALSAAAVPNRALPLTARPWLLAVSEWASVTAVPVRATSAPRMTLPLYDWLPVPVTVPALRVAVPETDRLARLVTVSLGASPRVALPLMVSLWLLPFTGSLKATVVPVRVVSAPRL